MHRAYRKPADLPNRLAVFPLSGALLFPRGLLPLNVFEPRYLSMVDDALAGSRLIGMIQPSGVAPEGDPPALARVGCAGRLTALQETEDGRYLITLTGVSRFRVVRETIAATPYRIVEADFDTFANDLAAPEELLGADVDALLEALRDYLERNGLAADWDAISQAPAHTMVNSLAVGCPFTAPEKQALLEAPTLHERCKALVSLLTMERPSGARLVQ